jgi:hypothetical protein
MSSSRNHTPTGAASGTHSPRTPPPFVNCDLCEGAFILPAEIAAQGVIHGLLVCAQCVEDNLNARADEPRCEVGLVGGSR